MSNNRPAGAATGLPARYPDPLDAIVKQARQAEEPHDVLPGFYALLDGEQEVLVTAVLELSVVWQSLKDRDERSVAKFERLLVAAATVRTVPQDVTGPTRAHNRRSARKGRDMALGVGPHGGRRRTSYVA